MDKDVIRDVLENLIGLSNDLEKFKNGTHPKPSITQIHNVIESVIETLEANSGNKTPYK